MEKTTFRQKKSIPFFITQKKSGCFVEIFNDIFKSDFKTSQIDKLFIDSSIHIARRSIFTVPHLCRATSSAAVTAAPDTFPSSFFTILISVSSPSQIPSPPIIFSIFRYPPCFSQSSRHMPRPIPKCTSPLPEHLSRADSPCVSAPGFSFASQNDSSNVFSSAKLPCVSSGRSAE